MLQSLHHLCGALLDCSGMSMSLLFWPRTGPSTPDVASAGLSGKKDHLPWPAGYALPRAAQQAGGCLCCVGGPYSAFSLPGPSWPLLHGFPAGRPLQRQLVHQVIPPQEQDFVLPLAIFM